MDMKLKNIYGISEQLNLMMRLFESGTSHFYGHN